MNFVERKPQKGDMGFAPYGEEFSHLIESVPHGIIIVDNAGVIVQCNSEAEKMFHFARGELLGRPIEEEIPVEIGLNHITNRYGTFIVASVVDITARKNIENELRDAYSAVRMKNEEMEQFVYSVSHDLKSPLVIGSSFLEFLREDLAANKLDEVRNSIDRIESAHRRMKNLIEDLLELSRIGHLSLNLMTCDPRELIMESIEAHHSKLTAQNMSVDVRDNFPSFRADPDRIRQVIDNLIGNALKYGSGNMSPQLKIFCAETPKEIQICIKDNGAGIDPKFHQQVFGLFQRLHADIDGTGVGLTIVSRIAQLHGGRAWVVSDSGAGAEFWFSVAKSLPARA